jgi:hypothetical protein
MLNSAKLPWSLQNKMWAQCANLATQFKNVIYAAEFNTTPYDLLHKSQPDWLDNLHTFGEIEIVHDGANAKIRVKLQKKGLASRIVGYPDNHAGKVCLFLNFKTTKLISSRTAIFLQKTYTDYYNLAMELISHVQNPEDEDNLMVNNKNIFEILDEESEDLLANQVEDLPVESEIPDDNSVQ